MDIALRTYIEIFYKGKNITAEISGDLKAFTFTDNESGTPDDIDITLKNDHGRWTDEWMPTKGDKITVSIHQSGRGAQKPLVCGVFTVDECDATFGNGSEAKIKAVSVPTEKSIRRTQKSRGWEKVKLSEIAADIAKTGGLRLTYATIIDPLYDRKDQTNIPDLQFLKKLCKDEALNVKISDEQIIIFDPQEMDKKAPIKSISVFDQNLVISASFRTQNHDTYSESTVEYTDPKTGKKQSHTEKSDKIKDGKSIKTVTRASSQAEAERKAKANLYDKNKRETTANLTLVGDTSLVAGEVIDIVGAGKYSGKYKISKATHTVGGGYVTSLELNHTNNPAKEDKKTKKAKQKKVKTQTVKSTKPLTEDEKWIMTQR